MEGERIVFGNNNKEELLEQDYIRKYNKLNEGKLNIDDSKDIIMYTKKRFEASLLKHKGPSVIPTIMRNHPDRDTFVSERESTFGRQRNPRNPSVLPFKYSFADDMALNILFNFNEKKCAAYLKHVEPAKVIHLKKEVCAEQAFEEMLSRESIFYSEDRKILCLSNYVDPDVENWSHPDCHCTDNCQFLVDFSILLPEERVSTVFVICCNCRQYVETVMLDSTMKAAIKDICHNVAQLDLTTKCDSSKVVVNNDICQNMAQLNLTSTEGDCSKVSVIPLSTHGCPIDGFAFVEGLMAVIPLFNTPQAPSVFVRTRLTYYLGERQNIYSVIHQ